MMKAPAYLDLIVSDDLKLDKYMQELYNIHCTSKKLTLGVTLPQWPCNQF